VPGLGYREDVSFLTLFGLVAIAEVATFFWVESRIGLGPALAIALATALIGSALVRRAGLSVLGRIRARMQQGELPGRELGDGAAILVAGAFLISPGFLTDTLGFLLLIPQVRHFVYSVVSSRYSSRFTIISSRSGPAGEVIDVDPIDDSFS